MSSVSFYLKIKDTIKNAVDLVDPVDGCTHKATKAKLYDSITNAEIGYLTTTINGIPVGHKDTKDRIRTSESSIILNDGTLKLIITHGSHGPFKNLVQPTAVAARDYLNGSYEVKVSATKDIITLVPNKKFF